MIVRVNYTGYVDIDIQSPDIFDDEQAKELALEEIESWPDNLFLERLELQLDDIEINPRPE